MKAKDLAEILMQDPEREVAFFSWGGRATPIEKVIKCTLSKESGYSFDHHDFWMVDDNGRVRKSWVELVKGQIFPEGDFVHDDTGSERVPTETSERPEQ